MPEGVSPAACMDREATPVYGALADESRRDSLISDSNRYRTFPIDGVIYWSKRGEMSITRTAIFTNPAISRFELATKTMKRRMAEAQHLYSW